MNIYSKNDRIKGKITLKNGIVVNFDDSNTVKGSLSIDNQCVNRDDFHFGSVFSGMLAISIVTDIDRYALYDAKIELTYELETADNVYTPYKMGVYFISEANRVGRRINIKALDCMINLDVDVTEDTSGTAFQLLEYVSEKCTVALAQTQEQIEALVNGTELFSIRQERIATFRDVISDLASVTCTFATINRDGMLELRQFQKTASKEIEKMHRKGTVSSDFETYYQAVKARFIADENYYPYDALVPNNQTGLVLDLGDISIVQGVPETKNLIIQNIADELYNVRYVPCGCDYFGNPSLELGDLVTYKQANGNLDIVSYIHFYKWIYRGVTKIKAGGSNPKLGLIKDKTYKQLINMEADVSLKDIINYSYVNARDFSINGLEEVEVVNFQYVAVQKAKPIMLATIQFELDCDGMVDITYYRDFIKDEERSISKYYSKGNHFMTLFASLEIEGNSRNELSIRISTRYIDSVERIHTADMETLNLKFEALLSATAENPYVEPEAVLVDTKVPTMTIAKQKVHAVLFAQGLNANTYKWDGTFTINEEITSFIIGVSDLSVGSIKDSVLSPLEPKRDNVIRETLSNLIVGNGDISVGTITDQAEARTTIMSSTIEVGKQVEFTAKYIDTATGSFVLRKTHVFNSIEQPIDSGLMCTVDIDTGQYVRLDGIEVIKQ